MMEQWIVVVERHDESPIVVIFSAEDVANDWVHAYNMVSERVWPHDYHNYCRPPQKLVTPDAEFRRMLNQVRETEAEDLS